MKIIEYKPTPQKKRAIRKIFKQSPEMFSKEDLEVIEKRLSEKSELDYKKYVAMDNNKILGFISYAQPWDTKTIWFLSWFAVDKYHQGKGIGTSLLKYIENQIRRSSSPRLYIETVSHDDKLTKNTRKFYKNQGYKRVGLIPHYYNNNVAKLIYYKDLSQ
ncbi:GNAT family N-acetyltransferase [Candidatus Dojkabacteria bacterium]|nr:GNAT family N-acetyltransferase [Candidatus Dojkabacteria bacterium]